MFGPNGVSRTFGVLVYDAGEVYRPVADFNTVLATLRGRLGLFPGAICEPVVVGDYDCGFRGKSDTDYERSRSLITTEADHRIRAMPIAQYDGSRSL
jgi:hypothetical protein